MDDRIQFRKAVPEDAGTLKEIAKRVIRHNYAPFLGAEATSAFVDGGLSDREVDDGLDHCAVMLCGRDIIGFAVVKDDLLHLIMVDVPFQRKGFGGKLLKHAEDEMFRRHAVIRLQSFEENTGTVRFYLRNGWRVVREERVEGMDKTMLVFEKA